MYQTKSGLMPLTANDFTLTSLWIIAKRLIPKKETTMEFNTRNIYARWTYDEMQNQLKMINHWARDYSKGFTEKIEQIAADDNEIARLKSLAFQWFRYGLREAKEKDQLPPLYLEFRKFLGFVRDRMLAIAIFYGVKPSSWISSPAVLNHRIYDENLNANEHESINAFDDAIRKHGADAGYELFLNRHETPQRAPYNHFTERSHPEHRDEHQTSSDWLENGH